MLKVGQHLVIDGSSLLEPSRIRDYETCVHHQLLTVMGVGEIEKRVGRLVLLEIVQSGKQVWIVPLPNQINAIANAPHPSGRSPLARPFDELTNRPLSERVAKSDTTIQFSPETWWYHAKMMGWHPTQHKFVKTEGNSAVTPLDATGRDIQPDDVLFHELLHAARGVQGLVCDNFMNKVMDPRQGQQAGSSGPHFDRVEEFYAVMLTNMYLSERDGRRKLRADHDGTAFHELSLDVKEYVKTFRTEIANFCDEMPALARKLSAIQCAFNPIDLYLTNPRIAGIGSKFDDLSTAPTLQVKPGDFIKQTTFPDSWKPK